MVYFRCIAAVCRVFQIIFNSNVVFVSQSSATLFEISTPNIAKTSLPFATTTKFFSLAQRHFFIGQKVAYALCSAAEFLDIIPRFYSSQNGMLRQFIAVYIQYSIAIFSAVFTQSFFANALDFSDFHSEVRKFALAKLLCFALVFLFVFCKNDILAVFVRHKAVRKFDAFSVLSVFESEDDCKVSLLYILANAQQFCGLQNEILLQSRTRRSIWCPTLTSPPPTQSRSVLFI